MGIIPKAQPLYNEDNLPVFVGRKEDLIDFDTVWNIVKEEYSIIKVANMPGIGKTEVIKQFCRTFGMHERITYNNTGEVIKTGFPLVIHINCKNIANSIDEISSTDNAYRLTRKLKKDIISQLEFYYTRINNEREFGELLNEINEIVSYKESFWSFMTDVFNSEFLADKYKLFFFDEIQALYGKGVRSILVKDDVIKAEKWFENNPNVKPNKHNCQPASLLEIVKYYQQGSFRKMSYLLSHLISPYTLIFVSGTQYSLLNSLGDLGSPVQGRVTSHNLSRLTAKESREWIDKEIRITSINDEEIWNNLCDTVIQLSGGIPRILGVFIEEMRKIVKADNLYIFATDFKVAEAELIKNADKILADDYIQKRLDKLFEDFGDNIKLLLSRISRHFMFYDYTTEEEIISWINLIDWKNAPHPSDLVEAGLMLRGNGNVVDDYSYHHSEQYRPENPFVLISKYVHNTLRKKFIDRMWLNELEIKLHSNTFNILKMDHSVVGFAFEYYLSLQLLQFSQTEFEFISNTKSQYFINIANIKLPIKDLKLYNLKNVVSYVSLKAINKLEHNNIYLLSRAKSIDGLIVLKGINILYQCKFRYTQYDYSHEFFKNFDTQAKEIESRTGNSVIKMLFTLKAPTDKDMISLSNNSILVNSDLRSIFGKRMIDWLEYAKKSRITL